MPEFKYRASSGREEVKGTLEASSLADLDKKLSQKGLILIDAKETLSKKRTYQVPVKRRELIDWLVQIKALLGAGVPVVEAFESTESEIENVTLKDVVIKIKNDISSGQRLHTSMEAHPKLFDTLFINMVRSGEESGTLPEAFERLITYYEWYDELISHIKKASRYPVIAICVVLAVVVGMFTFVVPQFLESISSIAPNPPTVTKIVMGISDGFKAYGWMIGILVAVIFFFVSHLKKTNEKFLIWYDENKLKIPVFGKVNEMICGSRFSHNMSALLDAGVLLPDALEISSKVVGNAYYCQKILKAKLHIDTGERMSKSFSEEGLFNPVIRKMIAIGEETGRIPEMLDYVANHYDKEIPRRIDKAVVYIEQVVTAFIAVFVLVLAAAIMLPAYGVIDELHKR